MLTFADNFKGGDIRKSIKAQVRLQGQASNQNCVDNRLENTIVYATEIH